MDTFGYKKGQSLIEILFAIAIFTIGVVTIGRLVLDSFTSLRYKNDVTQARYLAREGIEAIRSLRDESFGNLQNGIYGLEFRENVWVLATSTDVTGKFRRSITIGNSKDEIKEVISAVYWNTTDTIEKNIIFTTKFTNWMQTGGDAEFLEVNTTNSVLFASSTALEGITIQNKGDKTITITGIIMQWNTPALLSRIVIQGSEVFTASTSLPVASNQFIDIADYTINPYTNLHSIDMIGFDGSVENSNFVLTFIFQDTSRRNVLIFI